jgi:hypothetical protein
MSPKLTGAEVAVLADGSAERLLDAEERLGSQAAALAAYPELASTARVVSGIRSKVAASRLGIDGFELGRDARPFAPEVVAEARRVFASVLASREHGDPLVQVASPARSAGRRDDDAIEQGS